MSLPDAAAATPASQVELPEETASEFMSQDLQPSLSSKWEAKIIQSQAPAFGVFAKQIIKRTHARSIQKTQANIR